MPVIIIVNRGPNPSMSWAFMSSRSDDEVPKQPGALPLDYRSPLERRRLAYESNMLLCAYYQSPVLSVKSSKYLYPSVDHLVAHGSLLADRARGPSQTRCLVLIWLGLPEAAPPRPTSPQRFKPDSTEHD